MGSELPRIQAVVLKNGSDCEINLLQRANKEQYLELKITARQHVGKVTQDTHELNLWPNTSLFRLQKAQQYLKIAAARIGNLGFVVDNGKPNAIASNNEILNKELSYLRRLFIDAFDTIIKVENSNLKAA